MQKSKDSTSDKSSSLKLSVFDIEVLPNVFIISIGTVGGSIDTFEISTRVNQISDLKDYFLKGDRIFVGYNCIYYDTPVMNFLLMNYDRLIRYDALGITKELKEVSDKLINNVVGDKSLTRYKYAKSYNQIDLMTLLASQALRVGLKSLQVTMCYPNVEEMTVDWDSDFDMDKIQSLIYYCDNDILSTSALLKLLKEDLVLRQFIQKEFHIECLSKDGVGVGVDIFTKYICEDLGLSDSKDLMNYRVNPSTIYLSDIIVDAISFKTKPLQDTLKWFKGLVLDGAGKLPNGKNPDTKVRIGNLVHSCGVGGLHSENQPKVYPKRDDVIYRDKDVVSYYPSLSIEWGFGPSGFKTPFINVLKFLKAERVIAKRAGDKSKDATYKLALNSILGNLRNEYSPYYAPEANLGISINGQLMLLMLIETCELNGIECFMSNTDGATFIIPNDKEQLFEDICEEWSKTTRMELEAVDYEMVVVNAVNDYLAFYKGYSENKDKIDFDLPELSVEILFKQPRLPKDSPAQLKNKYVKEKGYYITNPRIGKGLDFLIIPKALQNYFGKGIPVENTIRDFKSIHDYMQFKNVGRSFDVLWGEEEVQHINRYYVSRNAPYLKKCKWKTVTNKKTGVTTNVYSCGGVLAGHGVQIANRVTDPNDESLYDIDYSYYIAKAKATIESVSTSQLTLF